MKTIKFLIALVLFAAGQTFAAKTEDRPVSGFHAVDVSGSYDVYITQGNTETVKIEAPNDVIKLVLTEVKNGTLRIYSKENTSWRNIFKNHNIFNNKKVVVYVTVKNIDGISLSGSGHVTFKDGLNANGNMHLQLSGSGSVQGKLTTKDLDAGISGSGSLKLSGSGENQNVHVSGSGSYSARDFKSANVNASVSGSGGATVYASNSLNAHVSGSGGVHYGGNPKNISKSKSGSGSINQF
ncbi:head GIN domain-containing protein [Mucilaginibacter panaciglaebae]|uniref:Putative auto-transporter adhesin head GIN domain-containing protein n=1 Tax=Mucilaginibacter panaciglaebae TaxID=502331 RepID=A0ABP7WMI4_9SPHI